MAPQYGGGRCTLQRWTVSPSREQRGRMNSGRPGGSRTTIEQSIGWWQLLESVMNHAAALASVPQHHCPCIRSAPAAPKQRLRLALPYVYILCTPSSSPPHLLPCNSLHTTPYQKAWRRVGFIHWVQRSPTNNRNEQPERTASLSPRQASQTPGGAPVSPTALALCKSLLSSAWMLLGLPTQSVMPTFPAMPSHYLSACCCLGRHQGGKTGSPSTLFVCAPISHIK